MKRATVIAHLCVPALLTLGVFAMVLRREPLGMDNFGAYVLGGYLFYAAPHLLWVVVAAFAKATNLVWHLGFIAASVALAVIASFWYFPPDRSGLPMQWLLYWPLAIVLQIVAVGLGGIYRRLHASNSSFDPDASRRST